MLLRSACFHCEKTRKPVLRTSCLLSQTLCFACFSILKNSQTRASHFLSAFADRLLVNGAGKTNAASQRLFFHCTCYILAHVI